MVREGIEARQILPHWRHVRSQVVVRRRLAGVREALRNPELRDAVQVRAPVREQLAEVAFAHGLAERPREVRPRVHLLPLDLEGGEEEQLVAVLRVAVAERDRTADVAARILVLALRLRRPGQAVRSIVGRQLAVAPVIVQRAVERGASRLGHAAHAHPAGAVLGGEVRALHLHFLNHVGVQRDDDAVVAADVDERRTVERDGVARRADAVDGVALRVVAAAAEADRLAHVELGDDARQDAHQLERAAADDRQVVDLLGRQHAFASAGLRLNHFLLRGDRHRLGLLADVQADVDTAVVAGAERKGFPLVGLESGELDLEIVGAREEAGEEVLPPIVADGGLHRRWPVLVTVTVAPGRTAAARVLDVAANRGGRRALAERCRARSAAASLRPAATRERTRPEPARSMCTNPPKLAKPKNVPQNRRAGSSPPRTTRKIQTLLVRIH